MEKRNFGSYFKNTNQNFLFSGGSKYVFQFQLSFSHSGEWSPYWVHSARRPLNDLLYLPRLMVLMMQNLVEWRLAGETEVFGENLP
jgi:hypothetical protein